jgi:hypothetical protein
MGKKIMKFGPNRGKLRVVVETEEERKILEKARTYFGDATTLIEEGLGISLKSKRTSSTYFRALMNDCDRKYTTTLTPEQWD